jgi:hypothetical protein
MSESVRLRHGGTVALGPCPQWCTLEWHFDETEVADTDDGYHHCGPEIPVPTSYREHRDAPDAVIWAMLKCWTHPLTADPGPPVIEVNIGTAVKWTDACAELTTGQARDLAAALLELAAVAESRQSPADSEGMRR